MANDDADGDVVAGSRRLPDESGWLCFDPRYPGDDAHVIPEMDLIAHEQSPQCPCRPVGVSCGLSMMYVHNAMDRRELVEGQKQRPN
jgi:hypothetical protein